MGTPTLFNMKEPKCIRLEGNPYCPKCFVICDGITGAGEGNNDDPSPGDFTICFYCKQVLMFGDDMQFIIPADDVEIPKQIGEMQILLDRYKKEYPERYSSDQVRRVFTNN